MRNTDPRDIYHKSMREHLISGRPALVLPLANFKVWSDVTEFLPTAHHMLQPTRRQGLSERCFARYRSLWVTGPPVSSRAESSCAESVLSWYPVTPTLARLYPDALV